MRAMGIRIAIMAVVALIATVFLVATGAFLCVALYEGLKVVLAPWLAALATAGVLLLAAVLIVGIGSSIARAAEQKAKQEAARRGPATTKIGLEVGRVLAERAAGYVGKNPIKALIGAVVLGFVLTAVPQIRDFLASFLKTK